MKHPRENDGVDIVIVNENCGDNIKQCLEGLFCSTSGHVNIIIIDQASTDGTRECLQKKRLNHLILNTYDTGIAEGMNQGIIVGRHEWICLLNPAVRVTDPLWLDKMWDCTFHRGVGLVEGKVRRGEMDIYGGLDFCLISRKCLSEIGLFDRNLPRGAEKADLLARIEWAGYQTAFCSDVSAKVLCEHLEVVPASWIGKYHKMKEKFTENATRRLRNNLALNREA